MKKPHAARRLRTLAAVPLLLLAIVVVIPIASAAPQVLNTSSATITLADVRIYHAGVPGAPLGAENYVVTPDGRIGFVEGFSATGGPFSCGGAAFPRRSAVLNDGPPDDNTITAIPADGTWIFNLRFLDVTAICLQVGAKSIIYCPPSVLQASYQNNVPQFWNYRSTTTTFTDDGAGGCATQPTDPTLNAEEDPNNAVFFSAQGPPPNTDPNPHPFTMHSTVTCPSTLTLNGAWIRGATQTGNTFATFYMVQGSVVDTDLRNNGGVVSTGYVDKGSVSQGTHTATVTYNNAAGNSYQLAVKNGTGGPEQLGPVLFAPPAQCTIVAPSILSFMFNPDELQISIDAKCDYDRATVTINHGVTQTMNDLDALIYRVASTPTASTVTLLLQVDDSEMAHVPTGASTGVYTFERLLPAGTYVAIARADFGGLGALDFFQGNPTTVSECRSVETDLTPVLDRIDYRTNQTNKYVNNTNQSHSDQHADLTSLIVYRTDQTNDNVNVTHVHIDAHFNQTWAQVALFEANITNLLEGISCDEGGNCTFIVDNDPVLQALEAQEMKFFGMDTMESWTLLLFLVIFSLAWYTRKGFIATGAGIGVFVVLVGSIAGYVFGDYTFLIAFGITVLAGAMEFILDAKRHST